MYIQLRAGLSNRLLSIIGLIYIAKERNIDTLFLLSSYSCECPVNLNLLYDFPNYAKVFYDPRKYKMITNRRPKSFNTHYPLYLKKCGIKLIDKEKLGNIYSEITLKSDVKILLDKLIKNLDIKNCHGIHLRMTDHVQYRNRKMKLRRIPNGIVTNDGDVTDIKSVNKLIDSFNDDLKILICSDCQNIINYFNKKYPKRIIKYGGNIKGGRKDLKRASIDMHILANCKTFNGTIFSTFSFLIKDLRSYVYETDIINSNYKNIS